MNAIADGLFWAGYPNQIVYLEKITASILQHHLPPIYDPDLATIAGHSLSSCHSVLRKPPLFPRAQLNQRLRKGGGWIGCNPSAVDNGVAGGARAPLEFGGSEKGAKSDFCVSEFSYYYQHPWICKAIYGADLLNF